MKKTRKELDQVVEGWLREHKEKRAENDVNSDEDFMGVMLSILHDAEKHDFDIINKATSIALILAAEDITSITLMWALSLLLYNSAGTWLIFNLQKIHRDPLVWENSLNFPHEIFMTTHRNIDVRGQNFELVPFGSGKRMCPGISFALQVLELMLGNLLHWFEFGTPSNGPVNMSKAASLSSPKATLLEGWLREHKQKRVENKANGAEDFMGVMLSILSDDEEHHEDKINKSTCLVRASLNHFGVEDTKSITLTWTLSLLLINRDKLSKVQQELDVHVGKDILLVTELDTKNLVYLQSIIKETLCLYPPIPLPLIHEAIEDCMVNGYHVSTGDRILNLFHGRRMCPRVSFALQILSFTLANVLHWFEFKTPSNKAVDMRKALGISSSKATSL
ncbi:hypothetical protein Goari_003792, partial [Gossypium aridum]|nr:hypothetical protein [Gossypium aridum]